jgi:hypothetical protein
VPWVFLQALCAVRDLKESLDATAGNLTTRISAEDRRALQAEKRRVYSEFQGKGSGHATRGPCIPSSRYCAYHR